MRYSEKSSEPKYTYEQIITIFGVLLLLLMCILHALPSGNNCDFVPINGTFQNYNPIRRFLGGQVPGKDFYDYLGMGHLFVGAFATFLFGKDFQASLIAFSFLSILSLITLSFLISYVILRKGYLAVLYTNLILIMLLTQQENNLILLTGTEEVKGALNVALDVGNSARFIRGGILPFSCGLLFLLYYCYQKSIEKNEILKRFKLIVFSCGTGLVAGVAFVWSNDFGISCWFCLIIMTFVVAFTYTRKWIKSFIPAIIEFFSSLISIFIIVEVLTLGHITEWVQATFGTGGYQKWYYNSDKSYYIYNVDFSYIMLVQACSCVLYLIKLYQKRAKKEAVLRYGIPAFLNMACFCMVNEYRLLSGGYAREVALAVLFLTISSEICRLILTLTGKNFQKAIVYGAFILGVPWVGSEIQKEIIKTSYDKGAAVYNFLKK